MSRPLHRDIIPTMLRSGNTATHRTFTRLALATILAVYFLILVGGLVRASGSGMGCPDWPTCFGRWVPPTDVSQLPADYQEIYADHGYADAPFNVFKTWTEYVNRLVGVVIGFLIFLTMLAAIRFRKTDPPVFWWSVAAFLLVGFQGWLGSVVVATNLAAWLVTVHMLVALLIVAILIYVWARSQRLDGMQAERLRATDSQARWLFPSALGLSLVQIGLGTQVRERVDEIAVLGLERASWVTEAGSLLLWHRTFSVAVLAVNLWLIWRLRQQETGIESNHATTTRQLCGIVLGTLIAEIAVGAVMFYFAIPASLQPVHLLLAALMAGAQFALWIRWREPSVAD